METIKVSNNASNANEAAGLLVQEGYATDPNYGSKLQDIMSRFLTFKD